MPTTSGIDISWVRNTIMPTQTTLKYFSPILGLKLLWESCTSHYKNHVLRPNFKHYDRTLGSETQSDQRLGCSSIRLNK